MVMVLSPTVHVLLQHFAHRYTAATDVGADAEHAYMLRVHTAQATPSPKNKQDQSELRQKQQQAIIFCFIMFQPH